MDFAVSWPMIQEFFSVNGMGSVVLRALIWFVIALLIIASTDTSDSRHIDNNLKKNVGSFLLFLILSGGLVYLLFGFVPMV